MSIKKLFVTPVYRHNTTKEAGDDEAQVIDENFCTA
jgi:hypothetical protein